MIDSLFNKLINQPVCYIVRASNMLCLGFGEYRVVYEKNGDILKKSKYALHVQTSWRIVNKNSAMIILASSDFYEPNSHLKWTKEFNWDKCGNNLFDEKSDQWLTKNTPIYVQYVKYNSWGDLFLKFTNGDRLEVFINKSNESEAWRFFECDSEQKHLVVTGLGFSWE